MIYIYTEEIYAFAEKSVGGGAENAALLNTLCAAASEELIGRLKEGTDIESIKTTFVTAAGVLALSMFIAIEDCGKCSFKAGSFSFSGEGREASAHSLRKQAEALLASYIDDRGFQFRSVEG